MRQSLFTLLGTTVLAGSALITGCASTATGVSTSTFANVPQTQLTQLAPTGAVLAVVRYPAFIDAEAQDAFKSAYAAMPIGGGQGGTDPVETEALADALVMKSNYYAMSLYRELADRLPEHSVLLSPHRILLDEQGDLTSEPITQAESVASVVAVDFTAYSYPDLEKMMGSEPLTFGDLVTPVVTVRTDPRAAVASEGVLLSSRPVAAAAAGSNHAQAVEDAQALQSGRLEAGVPELDFISHISADRRSAPDGIEGYRLEKIRLNGDAIDTLGTSGEDILEAPFTEGFANRIVDIINGIDTSKAVMMRRADTIADYDESLAALTLVGSRDADYLSRLRFAERLLEAEQKYLSVQSLRLYDGVVNGALGAQVQDMLKEEQRVLEERRKLARQQNTAVALGVLSAVVAGAVIANGGSGQQDCRQARTQAEYRNCVRGNRRSELGESVALQAAIQGAIFSATEAMRRNRLSDTVGENYIQAVVPELNAQTEVQVDLIDSNETITAIRFEDLKDRLGELYAENQRSLDTIATRCAYNGPVDGGTWLGACENGVANGAGVGVFQDAGGNLVEHYGYARNGVADGPGYRIVRSATDSSALEGNFSGGEANGVARIEQDGVVELRQFQNGRDVGSAPRGSLHASPFRMGAMSSRNGALTG